MFFAADPSRIAQRREDGAMTTRSASRRMTLEAMVLLPIARGLVNHVPMKNWRRTLGAIVKPGDPPVMGSAPATESPGLSRRLARQVERAAGRLPFHTKCLPRAVALQWMLRRRNIEARLIIAVYRGSDAAMDEYHAWVEVGGDIILGHCDRSLYRPLMTFSSAAVGQVPRAEG